MPSSPKKSPASSPSKKNINPARSPTRKPKPKSMPVRGAPKEWERGTPVTLHDPSTKLLKAPPPFIILLAISGFVSALCTTSGHANTLSYYDRRKWFGETEDEDSSAFSYELITFIIASFGGALSVLLSNSLTDDGSNSTKPGVQNATFSAAIFMSLLITKNPPLHCIFAALPFAFGFLVPHSSNSYLSRLSILAPQALTVFLTSYYVNPHTPSSTSVSSSASNLVVVLALLITFIPDYTNKRGLSILTLALLACVPPTLDFGSASHIPVRAPVTSLVVFFAILAATWLVLNHRHKHGHLTVGKSGPPVVRSFSIACLCSLRIVLALSTVRLADAHTSYARDPTLVLFQVFMGATTALLLTCFASAVAESWYPVGSMQFQMVAWDTIGLLFYFALPIGVLSYKAWHKYQIAATLVSWGMEGGDAYKIVNSLATLAVTTTAICLPMLNKYSNLCSNWFAKCYTHGQPNTNRVSITVDFADLFPANDTPTAAEGSEDGQAKLWAACKKHEARLTIFVTAENLKQNPHLIAELSKAHNIGITTGANFTERWTPVKNRVHQAAIDYFKVIGKQPTWYRGAAGHRHPAAFLAANNLGMRVAFWSTYGEIPPSWAEETTSSIILNFKSDFKKTRGGNILFVRRGDGNEASIASNIEELLSTFGADGILMDILDATVKKDHEFVLE